MFSPLSNDQAKQTIDCEQLFTGLQHTERSLADYAYGMHWKTIAGKEYLYRIHDRGGNGKSLGVRSPDTEKIFQAFHARKTELSERLTQLRQRMDTMRRINKALRLGSVPIDVANVCIQLNKAGLMGQSLTVIGTHALYAYESLAGGRWSGDITATTDIDLLWHHKKKLSLAAKEEVNPGGLIGILKKADKTFEIIDTQPYRAINASGYMVDLIKQTPSPPWKMEQNQMVQGHDLVAVEITNMRWLLGAPQVTQAVIAQDGRMFNVAAPDPRAFAIFKLWLSQEPSREPIKRKRDLAQAQAVINIVNEHLPHLGSNWMGLSSFPKEILAQFAPSAMNQL